MRWIVAIAVALAAQPALAAPGPEDAYAALHRATLAGDVERVLAHAAAARRAELAALPGKEDMVRMMAATLPETWSVTRRSVQGRTARLELRGVHPSLGPSRGSAQLVREGGAWKVEQWSWTALTAQSDAPGIVRVQSRGDVGPGDAPEQPKPIPRPADKAEGAQPADAVPTQPVDAPTLRKADTGKLPCVIKPVMSDAELIRCGATPPKSQ